MWVAKPIYESLPYLYGALGLAFFGLSWFGTQGIASALLLICGSGLLLISLVLWLRRRDFRDTQRQYNAKSLEESEHGTEGEISRRAAEHAE
jgi:hypothetical protein